jgi:allantoicase
VSDFRDLLDLASEALGGAAIACNDEFFAEKDNLLRVHAAEWREHAYTDRGKWMDGWETRRYRPADGVAPGRDSDIHDWCVVRLGMPGAIRGFVVDTAFFRGNFPDTCRIEAATIDAPLDLRELDRAEWLELVPRSPLQGNAQNLFPVASEQRFTHVRLSIFPDGGVARLRVHGEVRPRSIDQRGLVDLATLELGGAVEECSDMFFGSRNNLIKPGPSRSMADGWETRRRRGPGHDWAIVKLAARGAIERLEIDTSHFKGNAPALCKVEGSRDRSSAEGGAEGNDWRVLLETPLQPHTRHLFEDLRRIGDVAYLRLSVYPCGGVARLRAWATPAAERSAGIRALNALTPLEATTALLRCCGSSVWAAALTGARPFEDLPALLRIAETTWFALDDADHLEAFSAHPRIGATGEPSSSAWSAGEQASALSAKHATRANLAEANRAYEATFGFIFIVCATGRPVDAMLADCLARTANSRERELRTASEEQAKIMRLRLVKLIGELG